MIDAQAAKSITPVNLLPADGEFVNTAAATGAWTAVPAGATGYLIFLQSVGTLSAGTLIGTIESATDGAGTGAATVGTFTTVTTSNDAPNVQTIVLPVTIGAYVRYIGTLSAGTGDISADMLYSPKTA